MKLNQCLILITAALASACGGSNTPPGLAQPFVPHEPHLNATPTGAPAPTTAPTTAPAPTNNPAPSNNPAPAPSSNPGPSNIPLPTTAPTNGPAPTVAPSPTNVPAPTVAPVPTNSPAPTVAPAPSNSPAPSDNPAPTVAPVPTIAPVPSNNPNQPTLKGNFKNGTGELGAISAYTAENIRPEEQALLDETNKIRAAAGKPPLAFRNSLNGYAQVRAGEIVNQFSHDRPNGKNAVTDFDDHFEIYRTAEGTAGENIYAGIAARGVAGAAMAAEGFRNSPGHYKNMISDDFTHAGMGYLEDDSGRLKNHWVQIFSGGPVDSKVKNPANAVNVDQAAWQQAIASGVAVDSNHRIQVSGAGQPLANDSTGLNSKAVAINNNQRLIVRAPEQYGYQYQTVGEIQQNQMPVAYVNLGQAFVPDAASEVSGTYTGKAVGDLGGHSRVTADVNAAVNFNGANKNMKLQLNNSKVASNDLAAGTAGNLYRNGNLDFSEDMQWNSNRGQFEGASGAAQFYGDQAQEIGGNFKRSVENEDYKGAYGARKQ